MPMYRLLILLVVLMSCGCSYFKDKEDPSETWTAERLYAEAKGALDSGYYTKAIEHYEKLETRFPFGIYAQQSMLDLAYAYYKNEDHDSAVATCDRFIKLYPQNSHVDYAYYLKGLTNFNRGKGIADRFVSIDSSQRDPGAALQSFQDLSEMLKRFPESEYAEDARQRMTYLRNNLAQHEVHVANYYMRRGAFVAAANRARYVVENYPRTPAIPDALVLMAKAYKVLEMDDLSQDAVRVLQLNYPNHPGLEEVQEIVVE